MLLIFAIAVFSTRPVSGKEKELPKITIGAEWGYMPTFFHGYDYNFLDTEGFREIGHEADLKYFSNGEVTLHAGYNFNSRWNLSLHAGYAGIAGFQPVIPFSIRATRYWSEDYLADGWFSFMDIGSGICLKKEPQEIALCKIGSGYRISLSRTTKLDFITAVRGTYTHPEIKYYNERVPLERIRYSNGYAISLFFGLGLTF